MHHCLFFFTSYIIWRVPVCNKRRLVFLIIKKYLEWQILLFPYFICNIFFQELEKAGVLDMNKVIFLSIHFYFRCYICSPCGISAGIKRSFIYGMNSEYAVIELHPRSFLKVKFLRATNVGMKKQLIALFWSIAPWQIKMVALSEVHAVQVIAEIFLHFIYSRKLREKSNFVTILIRF